MVWVCSQVWPAGADYAFGLTAGGTQSGPGCPLSGCGQPEHSFVEIAKSWIEQKKESAMIIVMIITNPVGNARQR